MIFDKQTHFALLLGLALAGCVTSSANDDRSDRRVMAQALAASAGFDGTQFTSPYPIQSYKRGQANHVHIYIEGDGLAWITKRRPSPDPTPRNPVALKLAVKDPGPAVAWISRPCQYVPLNQPGCDSRFWRSHRFAPEMVTAMSRALRDTMKDVKAQTATLIGYSGGGTMTLLLAARHPDLVTEVRTIAGNLDPDDWTRHHRISPLAGSLSPMTELRNLTHLPQLHYAGSKDTTMPPQLIQKATARIGPCATTMTINASHGAGWETGWPDLLRHPVPDC